MSSALSLLPDFSRRQALRTFALAAGAATLPRFLLGQAPPTATWPAGPTPPPINSSPLGERFSLVTGAGGNIAVLSGDDGTMLVDCGVPGAILGLIGAVAKLASAPTSLLINTHWHYDHTGGNEQLAKNGARIIAHENCRKRLSTDQFIEFMDMKAPAVPRIAWPAATFRTEMQLHVNGEDIRLTAVPPAHTDNDVIVQFSNANVLHLGDLYFNGFYPFIDYSSGGWVGGLVPAIKTALAMTDAKTCIIPGHGPMATPEDLKGYLLFLETVNDRLAKLKQQGNTVDEAVAAAPTKDFDEKLGKGFLGPEKFVRCTYAGLLKHG